MESMVFVDEGWVVYNTTGFSNWDPSFTVDSVSNVYLSRTLTKLGAGEYPNPELKEDLIDLYK